MFDRSKYNVFYFYDSLIHDRSLRPEGVITVVSKVSLISGNTRYIDYGFALCNPEDQFCKDTGRKLATERVGLTTGFCGTVIVRKKAMTFRRISTKIAIDIMCNFPYLPYWAKSYLYDHVEAGLPKLLHKE